MKPALVVLNPRRIEIALQAFDALEIEKVWVTGYTECEVAANWPQVLDATDATHLLVASDDLVPSQPALDRVLEELPHHPVVTGFCNLAVDDDRVNLTKTPLPEGKPRFDSYDFYKRRELDRLRGLIPTFFAGMTFTGMSREMWERFPFDCFGPIGGYASDFHLSRRLTDAGVPIVAPKGAYCHHLKPTFSYAGPTLVGQVPAQVTLQSPLSASV